MPPTWQERGDPVTLRLYLPHSSTDTVRYREQQTDDRQALEPRGDETER